MTSSLSRTIAAVEAAVTAGPLAQPPAWVKVGVDLGTAYTVLVVLDEKDTPLAVAYEPSDVVRDGVVTDFVGAVDLVRRLKADVEARLGVTLQSAHGAFPPGVPAAEMRAVQFVIEGADLDCSGMVDEPTAANAVLGLRDGVIVDVGGGTTGIAVLSGGEVVHTADEPTGGTHFTLVVAGALGLTFDQAEAVKTDPREQSRLLPMVRPVMEKVASIVVRNTEGFTVSTVFLVGGTVAFPRFAQVVEQASGLPTVVPVSPLFVTPLGIAMNAPAHEPGPAAASHASTSGTV